MQYKVTYMIGEQAREAVMNQRQLDECRVEHEVVEAVPVASE